MTPTRIELEISVAGSVLIAGGKNAGLIDLPPCDFIYPPARAVVGAAAESYPVDVVLARGWAEKQGIKVSAADISAMLSAVPTAANLLYYLDQLRMQIYKAGIEALRNEMRQRAKVEDLVELGREIAAKEALLASKYLESNESGDLSEYAATLIRRIETGEDNANLFATGWDILDDLSGGGYLPGNLVILAARPSVGKTAAALQIAADCGQKTVIFSLEMGRSQIAARLLAAVSLQNTKLAARKPSQVNPQVIRNMLDASHSLLRVTDSIRVYDQADQTAESIRRIARREVAAGAKLIIIDYLQLINCDGNTREQAISKVSRAFKNMAVELQVPVILLSQLNRACESERRLPRLSDLRESGSIEQDADIVVFLHDAGEKIEDRHKRVFVIQAKGRDAGVGHAKALFNADHQRFYRLANQEESA